MTTKAPPAQRHKAEQAKAAAAPPPPASNSINAKIQSVLAQCDADTRAAGLSQRLDDMQPVPFQVRLRLSAQNLLDALGEKPRFRVLALGV